MDECEPLPTSSSSSSDGGVSSNADSSSDDSSSCSKFDRLCWGASGGRAREGRHIHILGRDGLFTAAVVVVRHSGVKGPAHVRVVVADSQKGARKI